MAEDVGVDVNTWVNVVRRARLGATTTGLALMLATYANPDGTRLFPGVARLAFQGEVDYRTVRRALRRLREVGLIEITGRGNRRRGKADEYRLILGPELLEKVAVPTPDQEYEAIEEIQERERNHRSPVTRETPITGQTEPSLQGTGDPPPSIGPLQEEQPPSSDLRASLTTARETSEERVSSTKKAGRPASRSALLAIAEARAHMAERREAHAAKEIA